MPLTLFDLDNTLITNDSDFLWGQFMVERGLVDAAVYAEKNRQFFADYEQGRLDIDSYLKFALQPLTRFPIQQLHAWRAQFVEEIIRPLVAPGTPPLLQKHRDRGDTLMIISATNLFITEPIAQLLDVPYILSTVPEIVEGRYSGDYIGIPTFREGKVKALTAWLRQHDMELDGSYFYSDSHNDLPLLEIVDHPVAVNPDDSLRQRALKENWPVLDLRTP